MDSKLATLRAQLCAHAPLIIAYSGGVDSTYLLAEAHRLLGKGVLGVIADSASLPRAALASAVRLAEKIGAAVEVIETDELANPNYASNPLNRCYFCKHELFARMEVLARSRAFRAIAYGENADDQHQVRPGQKAAVEFSVLAPLRDAGLTKSEIRALSADLGLPTANAPAQPCLSSRVPHGTAVTREVLHMIERGEEAIRALGFSVFRVRHLAAEGQPARARLQVAPSEMGRLIGLEGAVEKGLLGAGYESVEIDPKGYQAAP